MKDHVASFEREDGFGTQTAVRVGDDADLERRLHGQSGRRSLPAGIGRSAVKSAPMVDFSLSLRPAGSDSTASMNSVSPGKAVLPTSATGRLARADTGKTKSARRSELADSASAASTSIGGRDSSRLRVSSTGTSTKREGVALKATGAASAWTAGATGSATASGAAGVVLIFFLAGLPRETSCGGGDVFDEEVYRP